MATGEEALLEKQWAEAQGYSLAILDRDSARADWYRPDGKCIPQLPVDPYHRGIYRNKGWTLRAPTPEQVAAWKRENPAAWARLQPDGETVNGAQSLPTELQQELSELIPMESGPLPTPPRHMHVYQDAIGSPCLVLGWAAVRRTQRGTIRAKRRGKEG